MKKNSAISLPKWLLQTRTMQLDSIDVCLVFALVLRIHGTADALRQAARNMRDKVQMEHRSKMRLLVKHEDDKAVLEAARNMIQGATDILGLHRGLKFTIVDVKNQPKCHYLYMRLTQTDAAWEWRCSVCGSTQPARVIV